MTTRAKKPVLYAQYDTAIDGKHFASGEKIAGVDPDQLELARRNGAAGPEKPHAPEPAPEVGNGQGAAA
jgi:hypothetical protein